MNILDLFYTNDFNFVQHVEIDKVQFSDHNLIKIFTSFFSHNLDTDSGCVIEDNVDCDFSKFNYSTTDFGAVNLELSSINWRSIITGNIDDIPSKLNKTVFLILEKYTRLLNNKNSTQFKSKNRFFKARKIINKKLRKYKNCINFSNCTRFKRESILYKMHKLYELKKKSLLDERIDRENRAIDKIKVI